MLFYFNAGVEHVVKGYTVVTIEGFHLGAALADIHFISIKNHRCTSVIYISSNRLQCSTTHFSRDEAVLLTSDDVFLETVAGNMRGVYLLPQVLLATHSNRPIISKISFSTPEFNLHTVALSPTMNIYTVQHSTSTYVQTDSSSKPSHANPSPRTATDDYDDHNPFNNKLDQINHINGHIYMAILGIIYI